MSWLKQFNNHKGNFLSFIYTKIKFRLHGFTYYPIGGGDPFSSKAASKASSQAGEFEQRIGDIAGGAREASELTRPEAGREGGTFRLERDLESLLRQRAGLGTRIAIPDFVNPTERRLFNDIIDLERRAVELEEQGQDSSALLKKADSLRAVINQREDRKLAAAGSREIIPSREEIRSSIGQEVSGEELLRGAGPITSRFLDEIAERQGLTGEQLFRREGELPSTLQEEILRRAQAPGATFEDTLGQQLELARTQINAEANRRGVFGGAPEGGIRFEQLGRAGIDLAIKSALQREAARQQDIALAGGLSTQFLNLSAQRRGETAQVGTAALQEATGARGEALGFAARQQNLAQAARQRQASGALGAAQIEAGGAGQAFSARQQAAGIQAGQKASFLRQGLGLAGQFLIPEPQTNFNIRLGERTGSSTFSPNIPKFDFSGISLRKSVRR